METTSLREDINKHNINKFYYPSSQKLFRQYQYNIIKTCLQQNTLVCLPTGLGKTLIASIIMYNFIKWFTRSKLFFFAPTKPLVSQQKNSFTSLFPSLTSIITEITGTVSRNKRESLYTSKHVFFLTPQTLDNDLTHHIIDTNQIALLIFDEAHKAQKHYAYSNIVQQIYTQSMFHSKLRIIGLSASPGSTIESIQSLVDNLHISKIEFRTERDSDIEQYVFNKQIVIEEVETNTDIEKIQKLLCGLLQQRLDVLVKFNVIQPTKRINVRYLSTFQLLKFQQSFKERKEEFEHKIGRLMIGEIYQTFSLMFQLLHCKKKLLTEGLEAFKEGIKKIDPNCFGNNNKYDINKSKSSKKKFASLSSSTNEVFTPFKHPINNNQTYSTAKKNLIQSKEFQAIKKELLKNTCTDDITEELGKEEDNSDTKNHNTSNNNSGEKFNINSTHPKLIKLKSILLEHLTSLIDKVSPSKIIIFTEYKDSTCEITNYLNSQHELKAVNFACFTGQNKNFSQKDQIAIMEKFRNNEIQVLIATSVAEEGLDIGEVDLIICYDFSTTSPIKMIQRFGRTGRKRNGKVIVIVTKGEEKSKYFRAINRIKCMYKNLKSINNGSKYNDIHLDKDKYEKMIKIPNEWIEHEERFDLEKEKVEIDLSESEYSNEDSDDNDDNIIDDNATQTVVLSKSAKKVNFNFMNNNNSKQCDNNNNLFKEKMFSQTTNKLPSKKYASILKTSTKDNIKKSNLNTNNNYDILSYFTHKKETPKEEEPFVHKEITTQKQENKNPNEANFTKPNTTSKLLLSFKILPAKTDSGSKYKINKSNSCKRLSLKDIQDLNFNINTNNDNNNIIEDKKNENNEPLDLADDIFNQIIEEMIQEDTPNNNNNKNKPIIIDNDNKENSINNQPTIKNPITEIKQEHASNNLSFELSDDILQMILDNSFQETNNVKSNNETKPLYTKRNYTQYKEDHAIN